MIKAPDIVAEAEREAQSAETWADLSNALFDPVDGLVSKTFPTPDERAAFVKTDAYKKIQQLITAAQNRSGLVAGAVPNKSGRFVVRLPKTMHAALEREADAEGVSLNHLVVAKLAVQLDNLAGNPLGSVIQAFTEVRKGNSADRVVADPDLDRQFLDRCRELGAGGTDYDLNHMLFHARKNKKLAHLPKPRRYVPCDSDDFEYASEIAVRYVQMQQRLLAERTVSLDDIICDPDLANTFDNVARRLAPGFQPLDYRWAALRLRKARRLARLADSVDISQFTLLGSTKNLKISELPQKQGVYLFRSRSSAIFVGDTNDLQHRIRRHLEFGGESGLPQWLDNMQRERVELGIISLEPSAPHGERQRIELGAIKSLRPVFNVGPRRVA